MHQLPRGTVTFLFTDIEGSTRLLHEVGGEAYAETLAEHRAVIRQACRRHGGVEVDTQGDAFFVAFPTAPGAVAAAQEAQAHLSIPVRMGVHTGTPIVTEEGYVGAHVHEAARIASAGHGRQILVSESTAALVGREALRDLGEHRLKDLTASIRIYQVGDDEFPPLKTLFRTNLPVPTSSFVGRTEELGQVLGILGRSEVRLLTMIGPGGSGKTRLALHSAGAATDDYPQGVWWVPLAPLSSPTDVVRAAANALGGGASLAELVGERRLLLVLDNFEHVIAAADDVADLLAACPHVDVLVTSRERLRVSGEHTYVVPVLSVSDGRSLFLDRARATNPDFEPDECTDELCARLEELPLALELAAARTSLLTSQQILERLSGKLDLLRGGRDADARQRTLRAAIEWSYDLLTGDEQRLLAAISVFPAPWTLEAAEAVAGADLELLESLIDKSLLQRASSGRVRMLEMIREFAAEQLTAADRDRLLARLLTYLTDLFESGDSEYSYSRGSATVALASAERPNIDRALEWARGARAAVPALELLLRLEFYWPTRDALVARDHLDHFLELAGDDVGADLRARALRLRGATFDLTGRPDLAIPEFEEAVRLFGSIGADREVYHLMHRLAQGALAGGDPDRAAQMATEALAFDRARGLRHDESVAIGTLARVALARGDLDEGVRLSWECAAVADDAGHVWWKGVSLVALGEHLVAADRRHDALRPLAEGLEAIADVDDRVNLPTTLVVVAALAARMNDVAVAGLLWGAVEAIAEAEPRPTTAEAMAEYEPYLEDIRGRDLDEARERGRLLGSEAAVVQALDFLRADTS